MRMSNVAMGYIELLFASFTGDEGQFISIPAEEDDIYRRADGDGRIFPAFDPFYEGKGFHIPFHPHLSA